MEQRADDTSFLTIPAEVTRQLAVCEGELATCEKSVDMQRIASTSGAEGGRDDAHLDTAQLYIDVSRYVQALVRIVCLCEGRTEAEPPPANIGSLQDKLDKARARYERHTKAKKRQLTLGIEDANKVIAAVSKSKRNGASKPVKVDGKKRKKVKGRGSMEKHRTMGFLDELKKPT